MRVTIQTPNGRQYPFAISGEQAGSDFIAQLKYWEIFDRPILRIHDGRDTWSFNPAAIEKVNFETDAQTPWAPPENVLSAKCIREETYRRKLEKLAAKPHGAADFQAGKRLDAVLEVTLASGAVEYFECYIMLRRSHEQMVSLYRLFDKVAFPMPCEGGGFVLLNPKCIVCIRMHPAPAEEPDSAWVVEQYAESAAQ